MKTKCDFCKTEYSVPGDVRGMVRCAVCGHSWVVHAPHNRGVMLKFISASVAALAAIVFSVVVILHHQANKISTQALVATVSEITTVTDDAGLPHFVVNGTVTNQSGDIYGVPDLIIVLRDDAGREVSRQKFMPSATLLDPGASVNFSHKLIAPANGVKKITVHLKD